MPMNFFNKSHWAVSKLDADVVISKDQLFAFDIYVVDALQLTKPTAITASLVRMSGRDKIDLPDIIVLTNTAYSNIYKVTGNVNSANWNGTDTLVMLVKVDESTISVPLVGNA